MTRSWASACHSRRARIRIPRRSTARGRVTGSHPGRADTRRCPRCKRTESSGGASSARYRYDASTPTCKRVTVSRSRTASACHRSASPTGLRGRGDIARVFAHETIALLGVHDVVPQAGAFRRLLEIDRDPGVLEPLVQPREHDAAGGAGFMDLAGEARVERRHVALVVATGDSSRQTASERPPVRRGRRIRRSAADGQRDGVGAPADSRNSANGPSEDRAAAYPESGRGSRDNRGTRE